MRLLGALLAWLVLIGTMHVEPVAAAALSNSHSTEVAALSASHDCGGLLVEQECHCFACVPGLLPLASDGGTPLHGMRPVAVSSPAPAEDPVYRLRRPPKARLAIPL